MKRLLSIEFQKIWKNKASKVLLITYFVLLTLISLIATIKFDIGPIHVTIADQGIFNFPSKNATISSFKVLNVEKSEVGKLFSL